MTDKENTGVVPAENQQLLVEMDMADDEVVIAQMAGQAVTERYVYRTPDGPRLSAAGIDWACREFARQREVFRLSGFLDVKKDPDDPDYVLIAVGAKRVIVNADGSETHLDDSLGTKRQWKKMEVGCKKNEYGKSIPGTGKTVPDPFWYEKGTSKAIRNAKRKLIPEEMLAQMVSNVLAKIEEKKSGKAAPAKKTEKAAPAKKAAPAEKPAAEQKPAPAAKAAAPASKESSASPELRQRLVTTMTKALVACGIAPSEAKQVWKDISGHESSHAAPDELCAQILGALNDVVAKSQKIIKHPTSGKYDVVAADFSPKPPAAEAPADGNDF